MRLAWCILFLLGSTLPAQSEPTCNLLTINVDITALNIQLPSNISGLTLDILTALPKVQIQGTYQIAARYCEPEVKNSSRTNTLQLLVHGVTYTKDYWSGLGPPGQGYDGDKYSYVAYASKQGYPTLAIDRICNGNSSHPNGLTVIQLPANTEALYQVILQLQPSPTAGGRRFNKVIPVCHSEGATVCELLMQVHPDAPVATYVIHGFTNQFLVGGAASVAAVVFLPASIAAPTRFPGLDPTYLLTTSASGSQGVFYYGDYDKQVAAYDFANTNPVPAGELATSALSQLPAPLYKGSLLLLNGQNDQIFCAVLPTDPLIGGLGNCGTGATSTTARTQVLFPAAKFYYNQVANTGHDLDLHRTAAQTFKISHDYLASQGF
ncbi:hypothetical protein M409DRAFT_28004 [Zasmidium cellare ATCC 36951]|uniref:AB hydrolase-1 domain-containing protein n=1 Tax=Zasmidium cellare ATCC 36951 TaxID=1080233 RepID=A0A6A6C5Y5_ZASCE|nr:uncharacterized protein M409DRAFT_28004 [Zasmidium cellare ATCC 36951]KAF2161610.1 hypothetical protein M409DRAFT_28004 [Zasmidium cellare ATCC 36951]